MARKKNNFEDTSINDVKGLIRKALIKRYGSVAKFLHSEDSEKFGGRKIRTYLYDTGPINFETLKSLASWLGIGNLERKIIVTRTFNYRIERFAGIEE